MSNYSPYDYKDRVDNYKLISELTSNIRAIDIPYESDETHELEIKKIQKNLTRDADQISQALDDVMSVLNDDINQDFDNKITAYVRKLNKNQETDLFPYSDWVKLSDIQEINFEINSWWLTEFKELDFDNESSVVILLENVLNYWEEYKKRKPNNLRTELIKLESFINSFKREDISNFFNHILNGNPKEYIISLSDNKPLPELNKYNMESLLYTIQHWDSKKDDYFANYGQYLKLLPKEEVEEAGIMFSKIFLTNNINTLSKFISVSNENKDYYRVKEVHYENLIELTEIDSKYDLGFKEQLINGFKLANKTLYYRDALLKVNDDIALEKLIKNSEAIYLSKHLDLNIPKNEKRKLNKI